MPWIINVTFGGVGAGPHYVFVSIGKQIPVPERLKYRGDPWRNIVFPKPMRPRGPLYRASQRVFRGTHFEKACSEGVRVPELGKRSCPNLDSLGLLVHHLHVIVELRDIREPSKVLLLLGQKVLDELI